MKAFTDIEQSKKLAEILPLESADMCWVTGEIEPLWGVIKSEPDDDFDVIPSWSLAALLNFLAQQDYFPEITYTGTCYLMDINFYDDEGGKTIHPIHFIRTEGNTLVDACVEMILKLHEEKLI